MKLAVLGLMSGSSLDGLDLALVNFDIESGGLTGWQNGITDTLPLPQKWLDILPDLPASSSRELMEADASFGQWIGSTARNFLKDHRISADYIASHGHTIMHYPERGFTKQLGDGSHLAAASGLPVITDFRGADIAAGGQGAPLAPVAEKYLFSGHDYYLNLGGIANLTAVNGSLIRAWDIAAANQLLNHIAKRTGKAFDEGGKIASTGIVDEPLLQLFREVLPLPLKSPLALDNSEVTTRWMPLLEQSSTSPADQLRTTTEYIAWAVSEQLQAFPSDKSAPTLFVSGGGAHNDFLISRITDQLKDRVRVVIPEIEIIDFKEAILIALCGALRVMELPNSIGSVTGASHDTINGQIHVPTFRDDHS